MPQAKWWWFLFPVPMAMLLWKLAVGDAFWFPIGLTAYFTDLPPESESLLLLLWVPQISLTVLGLFKPSRAAFVALCLLLLFGSAGVMLLLFKLVVPR